MRNSALLLVSALAKVTPDLILHSIMPVFTFMGANVLRQDDEYSAYVVKQVGVFTHWFIGFKANRDTDHGIDYPMSSTIATQRKG